MQLIDGVKVKELTVIPDDRGRLMEILRADEDLFDRFGQVYLTTTLPGVVKAWHCHHLQTDNICCVAGMIRLALYDEREGSPTFGLVNDLYLGVHRPRLVQVPPYIFHGWKCVGLEEALIVNTVTHPYNPESPDEYRLPAHGSPIPFSWERVDR